MTCRKHLFLRLSVVLIAAVIAGCGRHSRDGDSDRQTNVRIIDALPDVASLDFFLDNKLYLGNVGYLENSGYSVEDASSQKLSITVSGTGTQIVNTSVGLSDSRDATLLVFGRENTPSFLNISDDNSPASEDIGKIRIINASYDYRNVDLYITQVGETIDSLAPAQKRLGYRQVSQYSLLNKGDYAITLTTQGTKSVITALPKVSVGGGGVYTVLIADGSGTDRAAQLVYLTDH